MSDSRIKPLQDVQEPTYKDLCLQVYQLTKQVQRLADSQEQLVRIADLFSNCVVRECGDFFTFQVASYNAGNLEGE